jgi:beta-galactosidase/beta-glucuronidase
MRKIIITVSLIVISANLAAQWQPAGDKIKTVWGENLDPSNVLPEYPRPIMERAEWQNLNGLWDMAVRPVEEDAPITFNEKILVPFPIESSLSGVGRQVDEKQAIWYRRTFTIPASWKNRHTLLHLGAADWKTEVFVNGIKIGSHKGGYTPFSFDITPFLSKGRQELTVKVWDPTDKYYQPRGKQVSKPDNIVYTPVSGIWQTVWLEPVAEPHVAALRILPDIDNETVSITINAENTKQGDYARVKTSLNGVLVSDLKSSVLSKIDIKVPNAKLWTPDEPTLYDLEITLYRDGKAVDTVRSYFAMRKISVRRDPVAGVTRIQLNNKDIVQFGLLDQGYWPDGLYTAPSDEALKFDIIKAKELGCNMLRKHLKVEPARWYTWCDRLGMLVWQDMPSGDNNWNFGGERNVKLYGNPAHENFFREWSEIIDCLYSYPSIVMWIPFNEGWGQFRTQEVADLTRRCDPSRLMNVASGWHHIQDGEVLDIHNYPEPRLSEFDPSRAMVLGEYGGIAYIAEGHLWQPDKNFGYVQYKTPAEATDKYVEFADSLQTLVRKGFSAAVYTQLSDVEGEANGILTYDRKEVKLDAKRVTAANKAVCEALEQ